jgi:uncharacterized protein
MRRLLRPVFALLGLASLAVGIIGIAIPLVPTTPFLLLAAFFFARSSDRFLAWMLDNRWFGGYIRAYREGRGLPLREKAIAIALLWLTIGFSVLMVIEHPWGRVILVSIAAAVTAHLMLMATYRRGTSGRPEAGG